jgi:hypothetical protein
MNEQNVGDINSEERGSGARFNAGKPPMELIPVGVFADALYTRYGKDAKNAQTIKVICMLLELGEWQINRIPINTIIRNLDIDDWKACAQVFDYGRKKYAEWNWAKGMKWSIPVACIMRHAHALILGEINDPESNLPHMGHIACNLVMLAQFTKTYPEGDDRPIKYLSNSNIVTGTLTIDNPTFTLPTIYEHNIIKTT